jgi:hypothetical protein
MSDRQIVERTLHGPKTVVRAAVLCLSSSGLKMIHH